MAADPVPSPSDEESGALLCSTCGLGIDTTNEMIIHEGRPVHAACFEKLPNRSGALTRRAAILDLLTQRRGQALCEECIGVALSAPAKGVYIAIVKSEGAGARRYHGECSACGKRRLVSSLMR